MWMLVPPPEQPSGTDDLTTQTPRSEVQGV